MNYKSASIYACVLVTLCLLTACSSSKTGNDEIHQPAAFPDPKDATFKGGSYVDTLSLKKISVGMNKSQIQQLIGHPHFSEGMFNVRTWNYLFNIKPMDGEVFQCQYRVQFDKNMRANSFSFKPENCLQQLNESTNTSCEKNSREECLKVLNIDRIFRK